MSFAARQPVFNFELNKEVSLLTNIQVEIKRLTESLRTGTFGENTITSLFEFENLRTQKTLSIEQIQNDIERLGGLFKTEPERLAFPTSFGF